MPGLIEDYGLIGDLETAALVGRDGSIDWLCLPRFDSPACFAALLDDERAGRWLLAPASGGLCTRRRYRGESLVLETEWDTPDGTVPVVDAMPLRGEATDVVRVVEGRSGRVGSGRVGSGRVAMVMELVLRFDYGSVSPWVRQVDGQWSAIAGPDAAWLGCPVAVEHRDGRTRARFEVEAGQRVPFVLTHTASHLLAPKPVDGVAALEGTEWFTQFYGSDWLDAALLLIPRVGFLPWHDERVMGTVEAVQRELSEDGLLLRYHPGADGGVAGLPGDEGSFLLCSFWLADALHGIGQEREARALFERLLGLRNDLGLLSEEYDTRTRRQLGNTPQAFSHVGLVNTALQLSRSFLERPCER